MAQSSKLQELQRKNPDDVVVTMAIRSPLCKAKKGGFRDMRSDELLTEMFRVCIVQRLRHWEFTLLVLASYQTQRD